MAGTGEYFLGEIDSLYADPGDCCRFIETLNERLENGDFDVLKVMAKNYFNNEYTTMHWLNSVNNGVDLSIIKEGINYLKTENVFQFGADAFILETPGSNQHMVLVYLVENGLITPEDVETIIINNNLDHNFGHLLQIIVNKNIPRAARNRTMRAILTEKLGINNRIGPINLISQMMGPPATVSRARKTRRRK